MCIFDNYFSDYLMLQRPLGITYTTGADALKEALILEASVTRQITKIAKECETEFEKKNSSTGFTMNDYHVSSILYYQFFTVNLYYF